MRGKRTREKRKGVEVRRFQLRKEVPAAVQVLRCKWK